MKERVDIFLSGPNDISFNDSFAWGLTHLEKSLAQSYHLPLSSAHGILCAFASRDGSAHVLRRLRLDMENESRAFLLGIEHARRMSRAQAVYLDAQMLCDVIKLPKMVQCVSGDGLFRMANLLLFENKRRNLFSISRGMCSFRDISTRCAAVFLEHRSFFAQSLLNRLARRRMRWLLPNEV